MTSEPVSSEPLFVTRAGPVATIWLNQPVKRNAMTLDMWLALRDACLNLDTDARLLIVRGTNGHFCAGADLSSAGDRADISYAEANRDAEQALADVPIPTIAFITGSCIGGGVQIAAACDLRICDATARFGITPARFGIVYPASALERVVTLVGPSAAKRLLYTAELIDAAQALRIGLVDELLTQDADEHLATFAALLTQRSLLTQVASKQMIDAIITTGAIPAHVVEHWAAQVAASPDSGEGVAAFLEGRAANFTWTFAE